MYAVTTELNRVNPFVCLFETMKDHCNTVVNKNKEILVSQIKLTSSSTILLFDFKRTMFSVILAFSIIINKPHYNIWQRW